MKRTMIFEKREATPKEKAEWDVYEVATGEVIPYRRLGQQEAVERLHEGYYPLVRARENSYIPKKYRNDNYIIVRQ